MRRILLSFVILLTAGGCQAPVTQRQVETAPSTTPATQPQDADLVGRYVRREPANGTLTLAREPDGLWRISVLAAGLPNGASTAADCELQAVGPLVSDRIVARLVAFTGQIGDLSVDEIGDPPGTLTLTLSSDGATLAEENASGRLCGMGSDLTGFYAPTD